MDRCRREIGSDPNLSARQRRRAHQERVDRMRALASLAYRPHDERLPAAHVAGGENLRHAGSVVVGIRLDVRARVAIDAELLDKTRVTGTREPHREQYEVGLHLEFAARHFDHPHRPAAVALPFDARGDKLPDLAAGSLETLRRDRPVALAAFLLRG